MRGCEQWRPGYYWRGPRLGAAIAIAIVYDRFVEQRVIASCIEDLVDLR